MLSIWCFMAGHDDMMVRTPGRLRLQCQVCGRRTRGWILDRREATHNGTNRDGPMERLNTMRGTLRAFATCAE